MCIRDRSLRDDAAQVQTIVHYIYITKVRGNAINSPFRIHPDRIRRVRSIKTQDVPLIHPEIAVFAQVVYFPDFRIGISQINVLEYGGSNIPGAVSP